jgi:hydroxyacylglutathione hydrolase
VNNLRFAEHVEPDNEDVKRKLKWALEQRAKSAWTVPSTIADEKKTNPFMRVESEGLRRFTGKS